jgi:hypothetical protein
MQGLYPTVNAVLRGPKSLCVRIVGQDLASTSSHKQRCKLERLLTFIGSYCYSSFRKYDSVWTSD